MKESKTINKPTKPSPGMEYVLTVARVGFGGNTGDGKYFYAFSQHPIHIIGKKGAFQMTFTLSDETHEDIIITNGVSGDTGYQVMIDPETNGRSAWATNTNSENTLFTFGLVLQNKRTNEYLICDPEVINVPDPHPTP
ncbi:MAG: hypothetical protein J0I77_18605 [Rudaea sp.]|uniref:hypothetical protein n=1 Tax=unclassified Rudaea TaxID=2627037 RepID=UPI0010F49411|nr:MULTISPECIES: hypothetical protein [unclassified Rudaea]MBN8887744.1 hypothetical protein [Rudaea sp.]